jgi:hypothetical protein
MKSTLRKPNRFGETKMRFRMFLCISILSAFCARGQVVFSTNSLPCQVGEYNCSYYSADIDVSDMLSLTNSGPSLPGETNVLQYWDFSQPEEPSESVLRTDIVAPEDGANSDLFPDATYAEQDTMDTTNQLEWRYYGFTSSDGDPGRLYYGLDEPTDQPVTEWAVFNPPSVDVPSSVQLGQTWSRSLYWLSTYYEIILASNYFTADATVDAFGTLVLPGLGSVPALRVHEIHSYIVSDANDPSLVLDINTNQYYYWLVPGIGVAAQVLLLGNNVLDPTNMPYTNAVQRMFFANYYTNSASSSNSLPPPPSGDLSIQQQGGSVVLNWLVMTNAVEYRVDFTFSLPANWQTLTYTPATSWTDLLTSTNRFYRVVGIP